MDPVGLNVPVAGSYNSAEATAPEASPTPPAIRTLPLGSTVAVSPSRTIDIDPVVLNRPIEATAGVPAGRADWAVVAPPDWHPAATSAAVRKTAEILRVLITGLSPFPC
jgi:hypothetical protein